MQRINSILVIDLGIISRNVEVLKSHLSPGVQFMAVVKANAYGHGAVEVARKITPQVDWFAVNEVREGMELREGGIDRPVLVFEPPETPTAGLFKTHNLTATVSASRHFRLLPEGTQYHINFNTGMGRLGFQPGQCREVLQRVEHHSALQCTGIYSHFATADEPNSTKMHRQLAAFNEICDVFDRPDLPAYISNTGSIIQYRNAALDMVRAGIGLYGYAPGPLSAPALLPALRWQTHLVQVNKISKGKTVSYGALWKAPENGFIGVIPVGYMDGIPRRLTGNLTVAIDGSDYPVVGTITMNYCMIWLGQKALETGTTVHLWNDEHTAGEWADKTKTIPYEILTGLDRQTSRTYTDETGELHKPNNSTS